MAHSRIFEMITIKVWGKRNWKNFKKQNFPKTAGSKSNDPPRIKARRQAEPFWKVRCTEFSIGYTCEVAGVWVLPILFYFCLLWNATIGNVSCRKCLCSFCDPFVCANAVTRVLCNHITCSHIHPQHLWRQFRNKWETLVRMHNTK